MWCVIKPPVLSIGFEPHCVFSLGTGKPSRSGTRPFSWRQTTHYCMRWSLRYIILYYFFEHSYNLIYSWWSVFKQPDLGEMWLKLLLTTMFLLFGTWYTVQYAVQQLPSEFRVAVLHLGRMIYLTGFSRYTKEIIANSIIKPTYSNQSRVETCFATWN